MKARLLNSVVKAALTRRALVWLVARARMTGADAALDPQLAAALELARYARLPALEDMDPAAARRFAADGLDALKLPELAMADVIDTTVTGAGIPVRIYVPPDAGRDWIVYLHGGGGVIGSIALSEPVARYLAAQTRCHVASVEYRLAPEHKHPAAIVDACAAWDELAGRVPEGRVVVAGDSFGAFLAAHVDRHARLAGTRRPDLQVLIYPLVDLTLGSPSVERLADGYLLTRGIMEWFRDHYENPGDDHAAASPWYWTDLAGSAPAIIATAGFDPLVDQGLVWAARLRAAGTPVEHHHHPSLIHSFLSFAGIVDGARAATDQLCAAIVESLRTLE